MQFLAKKSLGQNFLKSEKALREMTESVDLHPNDTVLEIGPGYGALTEYLLKTGAHVVAVEKDDNLFGVLQEKFADYIKKSKFTLVHKDILEFTESEQLELGLKNGEYKIAANIPYNITGQIFRQFLTGQNQPSKMSLLVQKEVAERIVARDGKESLLSVSVKIYGQPKLISKVLAGSFVPAPKVDSAIILIDNISREFFTKNNIAEEKFWTVLHGAFAHKRKTISGNLKGIIDTTKLQTYLVENKISPTVRAEDITIEQWGRLVSFLS
ncbi:MAG: 16S rRNA (adenine(1518)-N(6)/adenine(1519)-N(6))-dimethyltransferase RsmA [bacterium]